MSYFPFALFLRRSILLLRCSRVSTISSTCQLCQSPCKLECAVNHFDGINARCPMNSIFILIHCLLESLILTRCHVTVNELLKRASSSYGKAS